MQINFGVRSFLGALHADDALPIGRVELVADTVQIALGPFAIALEFEMLDVDALQADKPLGGGYARR